MTSNDGASQPTVDFAQTLVHIDDLLANGQGVGRVGSLVSFVTGALPGESVRIAVDAIKPNYLSAHMKEIVTSSPARVASVCSVFPLCGGCQTLHLRYDAQLDWKRKMVADALQRLGGIEPIDVGPTVASPLVDGTRYRNKVSLVPRIVGKRGEIGFYEARSHRVVAINQCPVVLPWLDEPIRRLATAVAKEPKLLQGLRHVVIRTGLAQKTLVMALCSGGRTPSLAAQADLVLTCIPGLTGLVENYDPVSANVIFGRRSVTLWGSPKTVEMVNGIRFRFGITSFFQINTAVLELIVSHLLQVLSSARRVVDLYCGVGTFAIALARRGVSVTGVESHPQAVEEAAANAADNSVTQAAFECLPVAAAVAGSRGRTLLEHVDAVILDPPRRGCSSDVLSALAGASVPLIEYLSCNPATLARDARVLVDRGYKLDSVTPFDMFPFTGHVEALAEFKRVQ